MFSPLAGLPGVPKSARSRTNGRTWSRRLAVEDAGALHADLEQAGIVLKMPVARPVDLAALRRQLDMTREQFALAYGLDPETVRNWEAGRRDPGPARAYLQAIENDPLRVLDAYIGA